MRRLGTARAGLGKGRARRRDRGRHSSRRRARASGAPSSPPRCAPSARRAPAHRQGAPRRRIGQQHGRLQRRHVHDQPLGPDDRHVPVRRDSLGRVLLRPRVPAPTASCSSPAAPRRTPARARTTRTPVPRRRTCSTRPPARTRREPDMAVARWYPTVVELGSGQPLHRRRARRQSGCTPTPARSSTAPQWSASEGAAGRSCRSCRCTRRCTC